MSEQKPHKNTIKVQIEHFYLGMGVEEGCIDGHWLCSRVNGEKIHLHFLPAACRLNIATNCPQ